MPSLMDQEDLRCSREIFHLFFFAPFSYPHLLRVGRREGEKRSQACLVMPFSHQLFLLFGSGVCATIFFSSFCLNRLRRRGVGWVWLAALFPSLTHKKVLIAPVATFHGPKGEKRELDWLLLLLGSSRGKFFFPSLGEQKNRSHARENEEDVNIRDFFLFLFPLF